MLDLARDQIDSARVVNVKVRNLFLLFVSSFGPVSWAAEISRDHHEHLVLQAAYNDAEFLAYACPDEQKCSLEGVQSRPTVTALLPKVS